ncbi:TonB-dependent receptor [Hymenobacter negativus]|uniref:TonB-dependent receptor n=1 Tax=Hymenobacter negativus TaxID=2795026 RepID=A0ABS3QQA4_9BACT|nr:TonB-dependent receptor [Hymenobacter negativus]MBO2012865.1 TonB-dependent receptor [Hymenobacter negativus]
MKHVFGVRATFLSLLFLVIQHLAVAQVTTSAISGKVTSDKGEELIGVTVVATNVPTGVKRGTGTEPDGRFTIPNLAPGGPYSVTVTYVGYKEQTVTNVFLTLGNTTRLNFVLAAEAQALNEVVVVGNTQATKTGAGTNVSGAAIQQLPTISRSISDFTRLDPRNSNGSFAGSSFRYNNVTLDGAVNNDAIGFSPSLGGQSGTSGLPGGSARSNPISLDAIQEIQAQVAPYDVKLGNFTGGSVNAVTRSGTNEYTGSVYAYGRNQSVTGKSIDDARSKIGTDYHDYQTGFRLGGPIIKNKLFFFTNAEIARRQEPQFYGVGQANSPVTAELAQQITNKLQNTYGYNVGDYGNYNIHANSNKIFGRLDFNLDDKTSIALRHNYIGSEATNLERSGSLFKFGSQDFTQHNVQNSTVLEVKSNFSSKLANNLILGYTNIHDYRDLIGGQANLFPAVQINSVSTNAAANFGGGSNQILLGSDREASIFNTRQKTFELTDNFTFYTGSHALTVGTHNEFYHIDYGFINSWNGRIEYNNVAQFLNDQPNRIRGTYNKTDNSYAYNYNNPSAAFNINFYSAYVQDEWNVNDKLKITPGLRFDISSLPTKPALNSDLVNNPQNDANTLNQTYSHTAWKDLNNGYLGQVQISPRLGFNYDANGDQSFVIRGGSGVFTGRVPFAWFGYAYYNNGVNFNSVDLNNIQPSTTSTTGPKYLLNSNPNQIYAQLPASAQNTTEVNLVDNKFKMPQVWRSSLAFDFKLKTGTRFSVEGLYTKTLQDVKFENINLADNVTYLTQGPTESPRYGAAGFGSKVNSNFSNAFFLTNTQKGYRYQLTGSVGQTLNQLLDVSVAYTYGKSYDISNGIRNSPQSNWELNPALNVNDPALAYSNFDLRHRVVASLNLHKTFAQRFTGYFTSVLTYASGSPYTWVYNNNFLGNGQQNVQLAYIPASASDITLVNKGAAPITTANPNGYGLDASGAQYAALSSFIDGDSYLKTRRGAYAERNAGRTPWNNQADIRLMVEAKLGNLEPNEAGIAPKGHTIQISLDIINFGNLLNKDWGRQYFVPNTFNSTVGTGLTQVGFADAAGNVQANYSAATFNKPAFTYGTPATYSIDQLASRWQGQLGLRYSF